MARSLISPIKATEMATIGAGGLSSAYGVKCVAGAAAGSLFVAADNGNYRYGIVGVGANGKSAGVQDAGTVAVVAGDTVTMTLASGSDTLFYEIYRTKPGAAAATAQLIARIPRTGATDVFEDKNETLPGTTIAILFQMDSEAVTFRQLSPMTRVPLATIDSSVRWMQLLYGVPVLHTPGKIYLYKNVAVD